MYAEQLGGAGVVVFGLLEGVGDRFAFGAIDGVLQAGSADYVGGAGDLADGLGQVFQLNDVA